MGPLVRDASLAGRWARWLGIIVVLIALVATVGGGLRDEFEIPGSDTQKATDLIESEFASEQGGGPQRRLRRPRGASGWTRRRARPRSRRRSPASSRRSSSPRTTRPASTSVGDPFSEHSFSKDGRIAYAEAQFDQTIEDADRDAVVAVEDAVRAHVAAVGVTVEYNGEAEFPPIEQGTSELLGLLAALIVLLLVFRTFVASSSRSRSRSSRSPPRSCSSSSSPA